MYKFIFVLALAGVSWAAQAQSADPTRPFGQTGKPVGTASSGGRLVLKSIIDHGAKKTVVINSKLLALGDRLGQYQLTQINDNSVVLTSPEKTLTLPLFSSVMAKSK